MYNNCHVCTFHINHESVIVDFSHADYAAFLSPPFPRQDKDEASFANHV